MLLLMITPYLLFPCRFPPLWSEFSSYTIPDLLCCGVVIKIFLIFWQPLDYIKSLLYSDYESFCYAGFPGASNTSYCLKQNKTKIGIMLCKIFLKYIGISQNSPKK
jgi:hypothetical protein